MENFYFVPEYGKKNIKFTPDNYKQAHKARFVGINKYAIFRIKILFKSKKLLIVEISLCNKKILISLFKVIVIINKSFLSKISTKYFTSLTSTFVGLGNNIRNKKI